MTVLFCHGLESAPHGAKYHALVDAGLEVRAPDCRGRDLAARVELLSDAIVQHQPRVVVGSSYGGIAGLLAALVGAERGVRLHGLLLCAPALALPNPRGFTTARGCPAPTVIVHGTDDEVCPISASRTFAARHGAKLVEVADEHPLRRSLPIIVEHTQRLLVPEPGDPA